MNLVIKTLIVLVPLVMAGCNQPTEQPKAAVSKSPVSAGGAAAQQAIGSWLTFGGDPATSQVNAVEETLTSTTVAQLHQGWSVQLPELADERPILVRNLVMGDGQSHDVLYLTTDKGTLLALDATSGTQLWATAVPSAGFKYTKASPAADPIHNLVYSAGPDGKVHRFRATTGQELQGNGWPVRVTRMPLSEKLSSSLNLVNGYLYVTTASFSGDAPPYQGHLVTINVDTGATHIFNSLCNDRTHLLALGECAQNGGGIWARPGVVVDPVTGHIFFAVSDGIFDINQSGHNWGDSVIEMTPDGAKVVDSYTPSNYATEAFQNRDIGSVAPALLPVIPQSRTPYLLAQAGKEGVVRLVNRQNMSSQGGPGHVAGELQTLTLPDDCPVLSQPISWQDPSSGGIWLFVADGCHMEGFQVQTSAQGVTTLQQAWQAAGVATSPILSNGVLYAATSHALLALDPHTGKPLWSSTLASAKGTIDAIHWESPIVVGGRLYVPDESNHLDMYQL